MISMFKDKLEESHESHDRLKESMEYELKQVNQENFQYFEISQPVNYVSIISKFIQNYEYQNKITD